MPETEDATLILDRAERYVIHKSSDGITVGLHLGPATYGEAHSPDGNVAAAVRLAYERARTTSNRGARGEVPSA
jgi:hypothetical protein